MVNPIEHGYYSGFKLHVNSKGVVTWQPNRYAGNHGARYEVKGAEAISKKVLAAKPKGSGIRVTSNGEVLHWTEGKPQVLFTQKSVPDFEMPPFNLRPNLVPGNIWPGPYDGERHHYFNDKIWLRTSDRRRCYWTNPPESLLTVLEKYKHEGGHFLITPWNDVIALIQPMPRLPPKIQKEFDKLSKDEMRLLILKKESTSMLPIYLGKLEDDFQLEVSPPEDFTKPLTDSQLSEMKSFLSQFMSPNSTFPQQEPSPTEDERASVSDEDEGESVEEAFSDDEFLDDDDFEDDVMEFLNEDVSDLYAPGGE